jgi:flagellar hook-length control protein FliK
MFEEARSTARPVVAQLASFGLAVEPSVPVRGVDLKRLSVVPVEAPPAARSVAMSTAGPAAAIPSTRRTDLEPALQPDLTSQIVQAIRLQWGPDGGDVRLRLQPQYLGELTVSLKVEHGSVTAHLETSSPEVRKWIEANEGMLRHGLAAHELRLDRLVVTEQESTPSSADSREHGESEGRPAPRRRRRHDDEDGTTFEVVV